MNPSIRREQSDQSNPSTNKQNEEMNQMKSEMKQTDQADGRTIILMRAFDLLEADMVASRSSGDPSGCDYCDEVLYRKPCGEWFLAYDGGPLSKWGIPRAAARGQTSYSADGHLPLSADDAMELLEQWGEDEAIRTHFNQNEKAA